MTYTPPDGPLCIRTHTVGHFLGSGGVFTKVILHHVARFLKKKRKLKIFNSITDGSAYKIKSVFFPCVFVPVPPPPTFLQQGGGIKTRTIKIKGKTLEIEYVIKGMF